MKTLAEKMHARALAGEDFVALQKEAAAQSGIKSEPNVEVSDVLKGTLPAEENQIFDLTPGGVSAIIPEPSGYCIYKLVSKQTPPLDSIRDQVSIEIERSGDTVTVRYGVGDDEPTTMLRLAYYPPAVPTLAGVMCASPDGPGYTVAFDRLELTTG